MDVEQDKIGLMPRRQLETERTLHGADQFDRGIFAEQMLDKSEIGYVIFDVEQGLVFAVETGKWRSQVALRAVFTTDIFCLRKLDPKAAPAGRRALADGS